jgi:hypothetical protein
MPSKQPTRLRRRAHSSSPPNHQTSTRLHGVTYQKIVVLFVITTVKTWNPTLSECFLTGKLLSPAQLLAETVPFYLWEQAEVWQGEVRWIRWVWEYLNPVCILMYFSNARRHTSFSGLYAKTKLESTSTLSSVQMSTDNRQAVSTLYLLTVHSTALSVAPAIQQWLVSNQLEGNAVG